jgi:hypothetical protein
VRIIKFYSGSFIFNLETSSGVLPLILKMPRRNSVSPLIFLFHYSPGRNLINSQAARQPSSNTLCCVRAFSKKQRAKMPVADFAEFLHHVVLN